MGRTVAGAFLAAAVVALGGCDRLGFGQAPKAATAPEIGRYVIVHSPEAERDTILLDTATGKTWSRVEVTDLVDDPPAWDPMPQLNGPADFAALAAAHGSKPAPGAAKSAPTGDGPWRQYQPPSPSR
jgi:hypothetical protein